MKNATFLIWFLIALGFFFTRIAFAEDPPAGTLPGMFETKNPQPSSVFDLLSGSGEKNVQDWAKGVAISTAQSVAIESLTGRDLNDVVTRKVSALTVDDFAKAKQDGKFPGGLSGIVSLAFNEMEHSDPVPTNMAYFINDTVDHTMLGTSAYAATGSQPAGWFKMFTFEAWKVMRNIALALTGVFLAASALMVMFQKKISAQVVASVYNILPYVPIAIALIVLSYPIVTIALNFTGPLFHLAYTMGFNVAKGMAGGIGATFVILDLILVNLLTAALLSVAGIALVIAEVAYFLYIIVKMLVEYVKIYMEFIMLAIFSPLIVVLGMLPGRQGVFMAFLKRLMANVIILPVIIFMFWIGIGVILTGDPSDFASLGFLSTLGFAFFGSIIKVFIGIGIINAGLKARGMVHGAFGISGNVFEMISPPPQRK